MKYTDLEVWKEVRLLVKTIYEVKKHFSETEKVDSVSQIQRAVIAIPSNIADN